MPSKRVWVVRVGVTTEIIREAKRRHVVAMGWQRMGDCSDLQTRDEFRERSLAVSTGDAHLRSDYGQVYRFVREVQVGDTVLTPDRATGEVHIARVLGVYRFDPSVLDEKFPHLRDVEWRGVIHRDRMSDRLVTSLDNNAVVFTVEGYEEEIEGLLTGPQEEEEQDEEGEGLPRANFLAQARERATELIAERLTAMDWCDLDRLVVGLLKALGYYTRQTREEARNITLIAHPDPLGFGEPRVRALVLHRYEAANGQEVRAFRMSAANGDRSLYVSLAGFRSDALSEPDLSGPPLTLVDCGELIRLLTEHYEALDPEARSLLPLRKVWVPE
jgi:restriction system protein